MASAAPDRTDVLRGVCDACVSISDTDEAVVSALGWVRRALGDVPSTITVLLPDRAGRLRNVATYGREVLQNQQRTNARRRAFVTQRLSRVELDGPTGRATHVFPLVSRGESVGVVEVVAPKIALDERFDALEAVMCQAAALLHGAHERGESERAQAGLSAAVGLAAEILRAGCPVRSVRAAADLCHVHLALPVVGWVPAAAAGGQEAVAIRGFGSIRRAEVRRVLGDLDSRLSVQVAEGLGEALEPALGVRPLVVQAGEAYLVVAGAPSSADTLFLETVASFLGDSLKTIGTVTEAQARSDGLDVGIAWTAHELRGPLLGARAAIDHLIAVGVPGMQTDLLSRTRDELERLAGMVDPLLRWSAGGTLHRRQADLVEIVRDAIASCVLEHGEDRVVLTAPAALVLRADPAQLRGAVANLVRNAIAYSPDRAKVAVEVGRTNGTAWVCVRDDGPGIPPEEGQMIFDLFARGSAGVHTREGAGLGLFITRRVVEAHGGTIRVLPSSKGAAFSIELPVATEERSAASAS